MRFRKSIAARSVAIFSCWAAVVAGAAPRDTVVPGPTAIATKAEAIYCFARVRGLEPERLPPAYLALRLKVTIAYRNTGARPLILPLERDRTVYTALQSGQMKVFKDNYSLFSPAFKPMKMLPSGVSDSSPIDPKNEFFAVIPASGEMAPPLSEEVLIPVNRKGVLKKYPDLRGRTVFVKLRFVHRELAPVLRAQLSDRWTRFGVPWTGTLTTNTIQVDVPQSPQAAPCQDDYLPAHPNAAPTDIK